MGARRHSLEGLSTTRNRVRFNMDRSTLDTKYQALLAAEKGETLEARVLGCFFGHPNRVGSPSEGSRPLDFSRSADRAMYLRAVDRDYKELVSELHFNEREKAGKLYLEFLVLLSPSSS